VVKGDLGDLNQLISKTLAGIINLGGVKNIEYFQEKSYSNWINNFAG